MNKDRSIVDSSIAPEKGAGIYAPVGSDGPQRLCGVNCRLALGKIWWRR